MIIHRRSLLAGALGLLGLTLLYGGWRAAPVPVQPAATKVEAPASIPATAASGEGRAGAKTEDFFAEYRLERERMRSRQVELLEGLADSSRSGDETQRKAQEQLLEISRAMAREVEVEQLLRAKGFADAVVHFRGDAATVVVKAPHVTGEEAVRISDLVGRGAGIPARNVFIIPRE